MPRALVTLFLTLSAVLPLAAQTPDLRLSIISSANTGTQPQRYLRGEVVAFGVQVLVNPPLDTPATLEMEIPGELLEVLATPALNCSPELSNPIRCTVPGSPFTGGVATIRARFDTPGTYTATVRAGGKTETHTRASGHRPQPRLRDAEPAVRRLQQHSEQAGAALRVLRCGAEHDLRHRPPRQQQPFASEIEIDFYANDPNVNPPHYHAAVWVGVLQLGTGDVNREFTFGIPQNLKGYHLVATNTRSRNIGFAKPPGISSQSHVSSIAKDTSELSNAVPVQ